MTHLWLSAGIRSTDSEMTFWVQTPVLIAVWSLSCLFPHIKNGGDNSAFYKVQMTRCLIFIAWLTVNAIPHNLLFHSSFLPYKFGMGPGWWGLVVWVFSRAPGGRWFYSWLTAHSVGGVQEAADWYFSHGCPSPSPFLSQNQETIL